MRILIADDEPLARERLGDILVEVDSQFSLSFAKNGIEVIEKFNEAIADVVLLDIRMPGMDGLETAQYLSAIENPPAIIFTTAYDEYALAAFQSQAVDYLLKPIRKELLEKAIAKCSKLNKLQLEQIRLQHREDNSTRRHVAAQISGNIQLIQIADVACFLADHKYTTVQYYAEQLVKETIIEDTLKSLEQEFAEDFMRIHRNALIRKNKVESLEKLNDGHVLVHLKNMKNGIEVSRRHLAEVRQWLKSS